jgi:hypothetical protein
MTNAGSVGPAWVWVYDDEGEFTVAKVGSRRRKWVYGGESGFTVTKVGSKRRRRIHTAEMTLTIWPNDDNATHDDGTATTISSSTTVRHTYQ